MPRAALKPGEQGVTTARRVSKTPKGDWRAHPKGTHWQATILIGQHANRPKAIRRIAESKREAIRRAEEAARDEALKARTLPGQLGPHNTPLDAWEAHQKTSRWQHELAEGSRKLYQAAVNKARKHSPQWFTTPLQDALSYQAWSRVIETHAGLHGESETRILISIMRATLNPLQGQLDLTPLTTVTPAARPKTSPTALRRDKDRILTGEEMSRIVSELRARISSPHTTPARRQAYQALLINTYLGLRASEILNLTWEELNDTLTVIRARSVKTHADYPAKALPEWCKTILETAPTAQARQGRVWTISRGTFTREAHALFNSLGMEWCTPHNIRKTVGSVVFDQQGARAAAAWLAHKSLQTTINVYVKPDTQAPLLLVEMPGHPTG